MIALDTLPEPVRQAILDLRAQVESQDKVIRERDQKIADQQKLLQIQSEKIRWFNLKLWGPKGEKLSPNQTLMLLEEGSVTEKEVEQEAAQAPIASPAPKARAARPNHPGRDKLPEHLERREVVIPCHPADCRCPQCGADRPVIGYETSEELACEPAR